MPDDDDDDDKEERKGGGLFHSIMTTSAKVRTSSQAHTAANTHRNTVVSYILLVFSFFFSYLFVLYRKCFSCVISRETRPAIPPQKVNRVFNTRREISYQISPLHTQASLVQLK